MIKRSNKSENTYREDFRIVLKANEIKTRSQVSARHGTAVLRGNANVIVVSIDNFKSIVIQSVMKQS